MVSGGPTGLLHVLWGAANGEFTSGPTFELGSGGGAPAAVVATDRDGDGRLDLAVNFGGGGLSFLLQGAVRKGGSMLRISPSLVEANTDQVLWGHTYEYDLEEISLFAIEDQVTSQVTAAIADSFGVIRRHLMPEARRAHLESVSVTEAVLRSNYAALKYTPQSVLEAKRALDAVLEVEPENVLLLAFTEKRTYEESDELLDRIAKVV